MATPYGSMLVKLQDSLQALMQLSGKNRRRTLKAEGFKDI